MSLEVNRKSISDVLALLLKGELQVPKFQREFVWDQTQVFELLQSVFKSRPIGLVTLWQQPQGAPHTESEPITLKTAIYRNFENNPAVMKLILDGRQRLTALAMAFGGLKEDDARRTFSGQWYLDIETDPNSEKLIVYKKPAQIEAEQLKSMANCLSKALIPLSEHMKFKDYSGKVHDVDIYPKDAIPDKETRERRRTRLADLHETFMKFQIPVAELPETVGLPEVCEIFDVLNTTGTKVSTFDLIHNLNYASTKGVFNLRSVFQNCQEEFSFLGRLCDSSRPEFFCQVVTGCYVSEADPKSRKGGEETIKSLKSGDLINTPTTFYESITQSLGKLDTYCAELFDAILGSKASLKEIPYPVSVILYISLRWAHERTVKESQKFTVTQLNQLFRASFWSNALSGRYDQGFLTLFSSDLKVLRELLEENSKITDEADWKQRVLEGLDKKIFTAQTKRRSLEEIEAILRDGDVRGAVKQALTLVLYAKCKHDLVNGGELDRLSDDPLRKVQLHHLFPKNWCNDNKGFHKLLDTKEPIADAFCNLLPLTAKSNNSWKTKSPSTAIQEFDLAFPTTADRWKQNFVDASIHKHLAADLPQKVWEERSKLIAQQIGTLQHP
jgi:hypothetical protein